MKKAFTIAGVLIGAAGAYAQGTITWNDSQTGYSISILSPSAATPTVEQTGETSYDTPSGSVSYTGGWIGGTATAPGGGVGATPQGGTYSYNAASGFEIGLYADTSLAALTTDIKSGTPIATTSLLGGANAGLYNNASLTASDANIAGSTAVFVGLAAWYSAGGAGSYSAAFAAKVPAGYVESTSSEALGGGGTPPGPPVGMAGIGLTSFSLATTTPEPSTIALGVMGASAFLMRLRRKQ